MILVFLVENETFFAQLGITLALDILNNDDVIWK